MHFLYKLVLILFLLTPLVSWSAHPAKLESSTSNTTNGGFNLSWEFPENTRPENTGSENTQIELQQSLQNHSDFKTIYRGTDSATVITGLSDGNYLYRARFVSDNDQTPEWSDPISVQVEHHSLNKAFAFFIVGAIVFIGTVLLILFGTRMKNSGANS